MNENEAIARAADMLTACIPSAKSAAMGDTTGSHNLVSGMMQALDGPDARLVLAVMTAFASRLVELQSQAFDVAPEEIVMTMRQARV